MNDGAAYLVDCVLGDTRVRHWVLSLPPPLRHLLAYEPSLVSEVLGAFLDAVFQHLRWKAKRALGLASVTEAFPGAVTAIQRCSGHLALNLTSIRLSRMGSSSKSPTARSSFGSCRLRATRRWPGWLPRPQERSDGGKR